MLYVRNISCRSIILQRQQTQKRSDLRPPRVGAGEGVGCRQSEGASFQWQDKQALGMWCCWPVTPSSSQPEGPLCARRLCPALSRRLLKFVPESEMLPDHLISAAPFLLLSVFPRIRSFPMSRLPLRLSLKNSPSSAGDEGSVPGSGRSPGEGNAYPLQ